MPPDGVGAELGPQATARTLIASARAKRQHRPGRVDVADLRGADLDAVVVELVSEEEARRLTLVKAHRDHTATPAHRADGLLERARRPAALERDGDAFGPEPQLELARNIDAVGREQRVEATRLRDFETRCEAIDDVDRRRPGCGRELRDDEPDGACTENDGRRSAKLVAGVG